MDWGQEGQNNVFQAVEKDEHGHRGVYAKNLQESCIDKQGTRRGIVPSGELCQAFYTRLMTLDCIL